MFLYGLLVAILIIVCLLLILVILIQQGKGGIGLGSSFGAAQMLFGGSGGQDIFQKITWTLGAIFMLGSLGLFLMGTKSQNYSGYLSKNNVNKQMQMPVDPVSDSSQAAAQTDMAKQMPATESTETAKMPVAPAGDIAKTDASASQAPATPADSSAR